MQDNSEESIHEREEGNDQLIRRKEEQDEKREWELGSKEIEGIEHEQDGVMPQGSTFVCSPKPPRPKRRKSPCEQVMLNSISVGRCCQGAYVVKLFRTNCCCGDFSTTSSSFFLVASADVLHPSSH